MMMCYIPEKWYPHSTSYAVVSLSKVMMQLAWSLTYCSWHGAKLTSSKFFLELFSRFMVFVRWVSLKLQVYAFCSSAVKGSVWLGHAPTTLGNQFLMIWDHVVVSKCQEQITKCCDIIPKRKIILSFKVVFFQVLTAHNIFAWFCCAALVQATCSTF